MIMKLMGTLVLPIRIRVLVVPTADQPLTTLRELIDEVVGVMLRYRKSSRLISCLARVAYQSPP